MSIHANLIPDVVVDGKLAKANSDAYHGGDIGDEIAALASLTLGVRLRVAGTSRLSGIHREGEAGEAIYLEVAPLAHPGRPGYEHIPLALSRPSDLAQLDRLRTFPNLSEEAQIKLVRAARAYSAGLWWANEDQNQSWLQLVTAVEVGADYRHKVSDGDEPAELIERLWPALWRPLQRADETVRAEVSEILVSHTRPTKKFVDFITGLAPAPPEPRPQFGALNWSKMSAHASLIYGHRSAALHAGKPFPLPMFRPPEVEENGAIQEVQFGHNSGGLGGIWAAKESPMLLATFEYITRGALLAWWDELIASTV